MPPEDSQDKKEDQLIVGGTGETVPSEPDKYTKSGKQFFDGGAPDQIFRFEKFGICYGTDDKAHAAAIILSMVIGGLLLALFLIGAIFDRAWIGDAIQILGTAFTLTIGVAIGQGTSGNSTSEEE